jgi:transcriptional regulator with XRE-family HTH domain
MANKEYYWVSKRKCGPPIRRLLPHRLREARLAKRMTQASLADIIGVARQAVSAYEAGDKSPDPDTFRRLINALEQPPSFFTIDSLPVFGEQKPQFFRKCVPKTLRKNIACKILGHWLVQTVKYYDSYVNFPPVYVLAATPNDQTESYSLEEIECVAESCRKRCGLGIGPITNVLAFLREMVSLLVVTKWKMKKLMHFLSGMEIDRSSSWHPIKNQLHDSVMT